ncbi:MAG: hypothetical protein GX444_11985 [Myxococcales bacterium]|nr:hypothetical protein [Myxococcales bacterium]
MRFIRPRVWIAGFALLALFASVALAGMIGKLYVKTHEVLMTERSGPVCRDEANNYCERAYQCPKGKVAHAIIYNIKEDQGKKQLAGLSLVCSDPNLFSDPVFVGASGENFSGTPVNDYCPVGYLLAGAEFRTIDGTQINGGRRYCRRYNPVDERKGPNIFGEGFDSMLNVCPDNHWVTGIKISFSRQTDGAGKLDTHLINARFYCSEVRHYLVEPTKEELEQQNRDAAE